MFRQDLEFLLHIIWIHMSVFRSLDWSQHTKSLKLGADLSLDFCIANLNNEYNPKVCLLEVTENHDIQIIEFKPSPGNRTMEIWRGYSLIKTIRRKFQCHMWSPDESEWVLSPTLWMVMSHITVTRDKIYLHDSVTMSDNPLHKYSLSATPVLVIPLLAFCSTWRLQADYKLRILNIGDCRVFSHVCVSLTEEFLSHS